MKKLINITKYLFLVATVVIGIIVGIYIYNSYKTSNYLNELTYDIVEESYGNYGNYEKSKYRGIVSEKIYSQLNYIYEENYSNREKFNITVSQHSEPKTQITSNNTAETKYICESHYGIIDTDRDNVGAISHCTVFWAFDENGVWKIIDFYEPP